jgi:hypothetical protein
MKNGNAFKNFSQICRDMSFESYTNDSGIPQYKNDHMKVIEYSRAKKISITDAAIELDLRWSAMVRLFVILVQLRIAMRAKHSTVAGI